MAEYLVQGESITAVADAIREKNGTTAPLSFPDGMAKAVRNIPSGGTDISLGITAATVGQTIKVKAVDTEGKPTAWEPVEMANGGAKQWRLVVDQTIQEDVATILVSQDSSGASFSLSEFYVLLESAVATENPATLFNVLVNNVTVANNAPQNTTNRLRYYYMYAKVIPEIAVLAWHQCSINPYNQKASMEQMLITYRQRPKTATSLFLRSDADVKTIAGPGSRLRIWGVDA